MKAVTVYQPWSSLIIAGAKPYEFRRWDYSARFPSLVGQRIVIHAAARKMVAAELYDILARIEDGESALEHGALPILAHALTGVNVKEQRLPLSAGLGTAILGRPVRAFDLFKDKVADSDRLDQHIFAWPLTEIKQWMPPIDCRGMQGFWNWPLEVPHD